jgi:hypothetical protein
MLAVEALQLGPDAIALLANEGSLGVAVQAHDLGTRHWTDGTETARAEVGAAVKRDDV